MKLEGKIALVTGGGVGIGRGIALRLASEGAHVGVLDLNIAHAEETALLVRRTGTKAIAMSANATDSSLAAQSLDKMMSAFGKVDILVNNVGGESRYYYENPKADYTEEKEWDDTVQLNLKATMVMSRAIAPVLIRQHSGKIVNVASIAGRPGAGGGSRGGAEFKARLFSPMMSYGVAKAGVIHFTRMLALQLAEHNINVNCVCPGVLYTPLYERSFPRRLEATPEAAGLSAREYFDKYVVSRVPLGREQTPEDIGRAVAFLASDDAKNITGQSINVDGGMVA
jgi:meso-butanediol dehydrogenase/(S,S)-butanediol dehydrogenase/diacetyl reductase